MQHDPIWSTKWPNHQLPLGFVLHSGIWPCYKSVSWGLYSVLIPWNWNKMHPKIICIGSIVRCCGKAEGGKESAAFGGWQTDWFCAYKASYTYAAEGPIAVGAKTVSLSGSLETESAWVGESWLNVCCSASMCCVHHIWGIVEVTIYLCPPCVGRTWAEGQCLCLVTCAVCCLCYARGRCVGMAACKDTRGCFAVKWGTALPWRPHSPLLSMLDARLLGNYFCMLFWKAWTQSSSYKKIWGLCCPLSGLKKWWTWGCSKRGPLFGHLPH